MERQLNIAEQEELFKAECKLINLKYEYEGYTGTEKWAIVSELTEEELLEKYPDVITRYTPFVLLSIQVGEVIAEAHRNEDKYEKRAKRTIDMYEYEDDKSEVFHKELITPFLDPFEVREQERLEREKEIRHFSEIKKARKTLLMMKDVQRKRLLKNILFGMTSREIAKQEGVNYSTVDKSIAAAKRNFKKIFENL